MYEKLPLFLHPGVLSSREGVQTAGSAVKSGAAPPSGTGHHSSYSMASIASDPLNDAVKPVVAAEPLQNETFEVDIR